MPASTTSLPELTADQVQRILVQPLAAKSVFLAANPRVFDVTADGPVRVPKMAGMTAPSWHGENELISEVEADTSEVVLLDGIKSVKSITRYSNELARSSVVALDQALRDRMVYDVASKLDAAFIDGSGDVVSGKRTTPLGITRYAGTQEILSVGAVNIDALHDAVGKMLSANADPDRARWMMRPEIFTALRKVKTAPTGSNAYVLTPDPTQGATFRLLGVPVTVTTRLPVSVDDPATTVNEGGRSSVVLADFSQIAVARDMAPSVKILTERYADFDQQAIRVVARYDAAPLNPEAVVILRDVTV